MTLKEYLEDRQEQEDLNEAINIVGIRKGLSGLRKIEPRSLSFFLGKDWGKGKRDVVADVDLQKLNAKDGLITRVNGKIKEFNEYMRQVSQDAVPDSSMNKGYISKIKRLKSEIDALEKKGLELAREIETKVKAKEKEDAVNAKKEAKVKEFETSKSKVEQSKADKVRGMAGRGVTKSEAKKAEKAAAAKKAKKADYIDASKKRLDQANFDKAQGMSKGTGGSGGTEIKLAFSKAKKSFKDKVKKAMGD